MVGPARNITSLLDRGKVQDIRRHPNERQTTMRSSTPPLSARGLVSDECARSGQSGIEDSRPTNSFAIKSGNTSVDFLGNIADTRHFDNNARMYDFNLVPDSSAFDNQTNQTISAAYSRLNSLVDAKRGTSETETSRSRASLPIPPVESAVYVAAQEGRKLIAGTNVPQVLENLSVSHTSGGQGSSSRTVSTSPTSLLPNYRPTTNTASQSAVSRIPAFDGGDQRPPTGSPCHLPFNATSTAATHAGADTSALSMSNADIPIAKVGAGAGNLSPITRHDSPHSKSPRRPPPSWALVPLRFNQSSPPGSDDLTSMGSPISPLTSPLRSSGKRTSQGNIASIHVKCLLQRIPTFFQLMNYHHLCCL